MNEICSSCAHKEVCRYEEEFKTKYEKIQEALKKVSCGDLIETDVKCKHYSCGAIGTIQKSPYNPLSPDWTYWPWGKDFNSSYNHCENCLNKHQSSIDIGKKLKLSDKSIQQIINLQNHKAKEKTAPPTSGTGG